MVFFDQKYTSRLCLSHDLGALLFLLVKILIMKLNPYDNIHNGAFVGLYPALLVAVLLLMHYFSGALALTTKVGGLRGFNIAICMSLLSGYFWFCIQLIHKNVVSTLISILVKTNQLSHLNQHRQKLFTKFQLQSVNCLFIAVLNIVVYLLLENLFLNDVQLYQYVITISAILFLFLFFLFLAQSSSNASYLKEHVLSQTINCKDHLNSIASLARLSFVNATLSLGAISLFPFFLFGQSLPVYDILTVVLFSLVIGVYLFFPVAMLKSQWTKEKSNVSRQLLDEMECKISSDKLEQYEICDQELERLSILSMRLFERRDKVRLAACLSFIIIMWSLALFAS